MYSCRLHIPIEIKSLICYNGYNREAKPLKTATSLEWYITASSLDASGGYFLLRPFPMITNPNTIKIMVMTS